MITSVFLLLGTRAFRSGPEDAEDDISEYHGEVPVAQTCSLHAYLTAEFLLII